MAIVQLRMRKPGSHNPAQLAIKQLFVVKASQLRTCMKAPCVQCSYNSFKSDNPDFRKIYSTRLAEDESAIC